MVFNACQGRSACRDDGVRCLTCGRSLQEIAELRQILTRLAEFVEAHGYTNVEEFANYVAKKLIRILDHRHPQTASDADRLNTS